MEARNKLNAENVDILLFGSITIKRSVVYRDHPRYIKFSSARMFAGFFIYLLDKKAEDKRSHVSSCLIAPRSSQRGDEQHRSSAVRRTYIHTFGC